jgi:hypothetical protein
MKIKKALRRVLMAFVSVVGSDLVDYRTGAKVARALIVCWGGRIYLIGLQGKDQVIPTFLPQPTMSHWKRAIGFTVHPSPDFPSEPRVKTSS